MPQYTFDETARTLTCRFEGKLDSAVSGRIAPELDVKLTECLEQAPDLAVIFQFGSVDYVASAFLRICLVTAKRLEKGKLAIADCTPFVKKVFAIAGFDQLLSFV